MIDAAAREFLRATASAMRSYSLYPARHPVRVQQLEELTRAAGVLLTEDDSFDFFLHEDSFFFGQRLLTKESLTLQWMLRRLQSQQITSFSVRKGAAIQDLTLLIDHLSGEGPEPSGSVQVNAVSLSIPQRESEQRLDKLRSAYSDALDLMREIGVGVSSGNSLPLGPARGAVESLVEGVLADRDSALLLATMRAHDEHTFFHMVNVCLLSVSLGAAIGLPKDQLTSLGLGAILHDMGKVGVPQEVLNKPGALSDEEWARIRHHPVEGAGLILSSWDKIDPRAAVIAYEHHLRLDGSGYPAVQLRSRSDLLSRIVSVADTFDAITSRRSYRRAEQRQRALDVLVSGAGAHYDPRVVRVLIKMLGFYPPGSVVQLTNNSIAIVIKNNADSLSRPVVKVVKDPSGNRTDPIEIDLGSQDEVSISRGLKPEAAEVEAVDLL